MGTDIYRYTVKSIDDQVIDIGFESGQSVGLAPEDEEWRDGFWVEALCYADSAFEYTGSFERRASCAITKHDCFRQKTGRLGVRGYEKLTSTEEIEKLIKEYNEKYPDNKIHSSSYGTSSIDSVTTVDVHFRTVEESENFAKYLKHLICCDNNKENVKLCDEVDQDVDKFHYNINGVELFWPEALNGPDYIMAEDYPSDIFSKYFIEDVKLIKVDFENIEDDQELKNFGVNESDYYWNTRAHYQIKMKCKSFLEHVKVNDVWYGR